MTPPRVLILGHGNAQSRFVAVSCDFQNFVEQNRGHFEILTFGYNDGVDIKIQPEDDFQQVINSLPEGWMPDFCLLWQAEWNLLPLGIESAPFPIVAYISDWDYNIPFARTIVQVADLTIVEADFDKEALFALGANKVEKFYVLGIMEEFIDPAPKKLEDRKYDILYTVMVRNPWYSDKLGFILKLCSLPQRYKILIREPTGSYNDYIALLRDSKMVLSYVRRGLMSVRTLEAGAQGTVCLCTEGEVKKHFSPGEEYIPVSFENFTQQVQRYLEDNDTLQKISNKIYSKVIEEYESRERFSDLIKFLNSKLKNRTTSRKFKTLSEGEKWIRRGEAYYYCLFGSVLPGYRFQNRETRRFLKLAVESFQKAVESEPTPRALTDLAVAKLSLELSYNEHELTVNGVKEIISFLKKAISSQPSYAMAYYNLGLVYFRIGNFNKALGCFSTTLELLKDKSSDIDPWCLQTYDFDLFESILQKPLNENLLLLFTEKEKAENKIRKLYESAILYYISIIQKEQGEIYKALEKILKSFDLNPECGLIAREAAELLALLGYRHEGIRMYKKAIELLPLDMDLRFEYINLLYLYQRDREVLGEIKKVLSIIKRASMFAKESIILKRRIENFARLNKASAFSHDAAKENTLYRWVDSLYGYLRKNPKSFRLVQRIIDIWRELGRIDKIFEIVEDYIDVSMEKEGLDDTVPSLLNDVYGYLQKTCNATNEIFNSKLNRLKSLTKNRK